MNDRPIGDLIKSLRKKYGLTQYELAKRSGISQAYLNQIESGKTVSITLRIAEKLATGFNMTLGSFLDEITTEDEDIRRFLIYDLPDLDREERDWVRRTINMIRERKNERQEYKAGEKEGK